MPIPLEELSNALRLPVLSRIDPKPVESAALRRIPAAYLKEHSFIPLSLNAGVLHLATADPLQLEIFDEISRQCGCRLRLSLAAPEEISRAIDVYCVNSAEQGQAGADLGLAGDDINVIAAPEDAHEDLLDSANKPPIIKIVNSIMLNAIKERATDIHIQPAQEELSVRYRVDGLLREHLRLPVFRHAAIISRIKIMAKLDIAEQRLPQDGRTSIKAGSRSVDLRVSTMPTSFGEKVVLRLLDKNATVLSLSDLGLDAELRARFEQLITMPNGLIMVVGPTGSGKTTTLYAALQAINTPQKNIITVEDPIEYYLNGIAQTQVKPRIGLSFAAGLRSFLRQDPDVIMVGEIRDSETAAIALQASLTGHLVFSTLHTNNATESITRLLDLGIEPYLLSSTPAAFLAQRLVRKICDHCRISFACDAEELRRWGLPAGCLPPQLWQGRGCAACQHTGYKGRIGIFELMVLDDATRQALLAPEHRNAIRACARQSGMRTLSEDGLAKVCRGITTLEEIMRITHAESGTAAADADMVAAGRPEQNSIIPPRCQALAEETANAGISF